jgi:hypothetical protein
MTIKKIVDVKDSGLNLRVIDTVDISQIKKLVNELTDQQWNENTSRQNSFKNHSHTRTYFLVNYDLGWIKNSPYEATILNPESPLWNSVKPLVEFLESYHDGKVGRVILPKLISGGIIDGHKDGGDYLESVRRHHIPIVTNERVSFSVGEEIVSMREGEVWEINNNFVHEVENPSEQDRIHLLIDIIPNKYLS